MSDRIKAVEQWLRGQSVPGVDFELNASVEITDGPHKGKRGAVVSLLAVEPDAVLIVELSDGNDVQVEQSHLQSVDPPA